MLLNSFLKKSKVLEMNGIKYVIVDQIGEGAFGYVYKVKEHAPLSPHSNSQSTYYAIKKMICQSEVQLEEAKKEIQLLQEIDHGNVLPLIHSTVLSTKSENVEVYLLLPLYQQSLQNLIDSGSSGYPHCSFVDRNLVRKVFFGCASGVHAIHSAGYRHGDLKPANILLDPLHNPVITDFGSAEKLICEVFTRQQALTIQDNASVKTTASFRAPELFDTPSQCVVDGKSDVWGLGCTFYATLFSRTPFEAQVDGLSVLAVLSGNFSFPSTSTWPPEYHTMISACLRVDLEQRLSIEDLKILTSILPDPLVDPVAALDNHLSATFSSQDLLHTSASLSPSTHKAESFGQSLLKKLTSKEVPPETPPPKHTDAPNLSSFADFEHFPEPNSVNNSPVITRPVVPAVSPSVEKSMPPHEVTPEMSKVMKEAEDWGGEDADEWDFQSCEATLLTPADISQETPNLPTVMPPSVTTTTLPIEYLANNSTPHISSPDIINQDSDDFEFGDFQVASGEPVDHL
jgi:serine/threonine kinase 16